MEEEGHGWEGSCGKEDFEIEVGDEKVLVLKDMVAKEEALDRGREPDEEWLRCL